MLLHVHVDGCDSKKEEKRMRATFFEVTGHFFLIFYLLLVASD